MRDTGGKKRGRRACFNRIVCLSFGIHDEKEDLRSSTSVSIPTEGEDTNDKNSINLISTRGDRGGMHVRTA